MKADEQEMLILEIEKDIDRLHALYNQYFMGIEKVEPTIPRKNLDRKIHQIRGKRIQNTALSFRLQMQIQRYNTQATYWGRVCREIEAGTYKRHVMLAKRRSAARTTMDMPTSAPPPPNDPLFKDSVPPAIHTVDLDNFDISLDDPFVMDIQPSSSPPVAATPTPKPAVSLDDPFSEAAPKKPKRPMPPPVPRSQGRRSIPPVKPTSKNTPNPQSPVMSSIPPSYATEMTEYRAKELYNNYIHARKKCNQPTDNVSFRKVAKTLGKKYVASQGEVEFKVVIKDGKAAIVSKKRKTK